MLRSFSIGFLFTACVLCAGCNPFAPALEEGNPFGDLLGDPTTIEGFFANFRNAYELRDLSLYEPLLDSSFIFVWHDFDAQVDREWGFMPIKFEDLEFAVRELKAILDPALMLIAEVEGKPIGVSVTIPNVNEFMATAKSSRGLLRLLKLAWYVQTRRPRQLRLVILGVDKDYRSKGVAAAFYLETLRRAAKRYDGGEVSWIQDINTEIIKAIELMGGERSKTYRILEKVVSAA